MDGESCSPIIRIDGPLLLFIIPFIRWGIIAMTKQRAQHSCRCSIIPLDLVLTGHDHTMVHLEARERCSSGFQRQGTIYVVLFRAQGVPVNQPVQKNLWQSLEKKYNYFKKSQLKEKPSLFGYRSRWIDIRFI